MKRTDFLDRINTCLKQNTLPTTEHKPNLSNFNLKTTRKSLINQFIHEAHAVKAQAHLTFDYNSATEKIIDILSNQPNKQYISWNENWLPIPNLISILKKEYYERCPNNIPSDADKRHAIYKQLEQIPVGITGCSAGLADTGSIILESNPGQGRLCSLIVPVHIALIHSNQIYQNMASYINVQPDIGERSSNLNIVTGPSRTSDITQTLTLGVHGPGTLHIIIIDMQ